jgi:hypothetical protein
MLATRTIVTDTQVAKLLQASLRPAARASLCAARLRRDDGPHDGCSNSIMLAATACEWFEHENEN